MLTVQVAPFGAIIAPQVLAGNMAKSAAAPVAEVRVTAALVNAIAAALLFLTITDCAAVGVPVAFEVNDSELGDTV